jgi:hypothetical protein
MPTYVACCETNQRLVCDILQLANRLFSWGQSKCIQLQSKPSDMGILELHYPVSFGVFFGVFW